MNFAVQMPGEIDGTLVETPWRVEHEADGCRLSHADDADETRQVYALGAFLTAEDAVDALRRAFDL